MQPRPPLSERLYRALLVLFPGGVRRQYGEEIVSTFRELRRDRRGSPAKVALFLLRAYLDLFTSAARAHRFERDRAARQKLRVRMMWKHDFSVALRQLRKSPGFACFAALTMALGIGANTAIFSAVYGVLLRPLGLEDPASIAVVRLHRKGRLDDESGFFPDYLRDVREQALRSPTIAAVTSYVYESVTLEREGEIDALDSALVVEDNFFDVMGVEPIRGRTFSPEDVVPNRRSPVCVLGESLWRGRFGGDPGVVGSTLRLDGEPVRVVGIVPAGLPLPSADVSIWLPQSWDVDDVTLRGRVLALARLRSGEDLPEARAILAAAAVELSRVHPRFEDYTLSLEPFQETVVGAARAPLLLATVAVGLLLLIACANTANLLLSRALLRAREMATRRALGARGAQVTSQLLAESLALALPGGALGILLAVGLHRALLSVAPRELPRVHDVQLDLPVLAFAAVVTVLSGVAFGLAPLGHAFRADLARQMAGGAASGSGLGERPPQLTRVLVVLQLTLAVSLVCAAVLMMRSLWNLQSVDPGFRVQGIGGARIYLDANAYPDDGAEAAYFSTLLERLRDRRDIRSVGASSGLPFDSVTIDFDLPYELPGGEPSGEEVAQAYFRVATPGYVETLGIPLLAGRTFEERDQRDTQPVAIINETFARIGWPDRNPVGERFLIYGGRRELSVVGIVGDVHFAGPEAAYKPEFYVAHAQFPFSAMTVVTRSADAAAGARAIAEEAQSLNRRQPVSSLFTLESLAFDVISTERFLAVTLLAFGAVALFLAASGVYGVISYWVDRSRGELGVRMAFGASRGDVLSLVMKRALSIAASGVLLGWVVSAAASPLLARFLFGVDALDALTFASVPLILAATAVTAAFVPGLRASRLDATRLLRAE